MEKFLGEEKITFLFNSAIFLSSSSEDPMCLGLWCSAPSSERLTGFRTVLALLGAVPVVEEGAGFDTALRGAVYVCK
jgi:hypothetical protein